MSPWLWRYRNYYYYYYYYYYLLLLLLSLLLLLFGPDTSDSMHENRVLVNFGNFSPHSY